MRVGRTSFSVFATLLLQACGCHADGGLVGDPDSRSDAPAVDGPVDVDSDAPPTWECLSDDDCDDADPCTADSCVMEERVCIHEAITGLALAGPDVQVTDDPRYSGLPEMEWTGSEIGLVWGDGRDGECYESWEASWCNYELYFKRVGPGAEPLSEDVRMSDTSRHSHWYDLIWTGGFFTLSWGDSTLDEGRIFFSIFASEDDLPGTPRQPSGGLTRAGSPGAAWTGSELATLWSTSDEYPMREANIMFTRYLADGTEVSTHLLLGSDLGYYYCGSPSWAGGELVVACNGHDGAILRLSPVGELLGEPSPLSELRMFGYNPVILWTGEERIVLLQGSLEADDPCLDSLPRCTNLFTFRLDPDGSVSGEIVRLTGTPGETRMTGAVWTGSEIGLTWYDDDGWGRKPYLTRIDPAGTRIDDDFALPQRSSLVWTGSEYVLGWSEDRGDGYNIFMNRTVYCE